VLRVLRVLGQTVCRHRLALPPRRILTRTDGQKVTRTLVCLCDQIGTQREKELLTVEESHVTSPCVTGGSRMAFVQLDDRPESQEDTIRNSAQGTLYVANSQLAPAPSHPSKSLGCTIRQEEERGKSELT
jgi:hypothetical protein